MVAIAGNITESLAITDWRVSAHKVKDGSLSGTTATSGTTYSITCTNSEPCNVTISPKIDKPWSASVAMPIDTYVVPSSPDTTPHLYKVTTSPTGNPNYNESILLLRGTGADESTTFTDLSVSPKTITTNGNAKVETSVTTPFGDSTGMMYFDGVGDYLSAPSSTDFNIGSGTFSLRLFFRADAIGTRQLLCGRANSGGSVLSLMLEITTTGAIKAWMESGDTYSITSSSSVVAANTIYHVEYNRIGNTLYLFLDGTLVGTRAFSSASADPANMFSIGRVGEYDGLYFKGFISNFELYKGGTDYHVTTFTPPTAPFIASVNSVTGSIEPTWNTSGTTIEGNITYTHIAELDDAMFKTLGVKVPS